MLLLSHPSATPSITLFESFPLLSNVVSNPSPLSLYTTLSLTPRPRRSGREGDVWDGLHHLQASQRLRPAAEHSR